MANLQVSEEDREEAALICRVAASNHPGFYATVIESLGIDLYSKSATLAYTAWGHVHAKPNALRGAPTDALAAELIACLSGCHPEEGLSE